MLAMTAVIVD